MRIRDNFILGKLTDMNLVVYAGAERYDSMLSLNDTGAFIFEKLQKGATPEETAQALTEEYDVALETASTDVRNTINALIEAGVAEA